MDVEANVRHHTGSAALAGALLIFFGFFYLAEPTGTDLYGKAAAVFFHTLRLGGLVMIAVAVWLSLGHLLALIVDVAVSVIIGALFIVTGVVMIIDGGGILQTLINVVCGTMFIATGLQYRSDYKHLVRLCMGDGYLRDEDVDVLAAPEDSPLTNQLSKRRGKRIRRTKRGGTPWLASPGLVNFKPPPRHRPRTTPVEEERPLRLDDPPHNPAEDSPTAEAPPPPEGYLADLAKRVRPRKK